MARRVEDLLRRVRGRDEAAVEGLVSAFRPIATAEAFRACGDPDMAEDAAQAAFLTLFRRAPKLKEGPLGSWLHHVAVCISRDLFRTQQVRRRHEQAVAEARQQAAALSHSPECSEDARELHGLLHQSCMRAKR